MLLSSDQYLAPAVAELSAAGEVGWASGRELNVADPVRWSKATAWTRACAKEAETKGWTSASQGGEEEWLLKEENYFSRNVDFNSQEEGEANITMLQNLVRYG